jgi:hypothetical protein
MNGGGPQRKNSGDDMSLTVFSVNSRPDIARVDQTIPREIATVQHGAEDSSAGIAIGPFE